MNENSKESKFLEAINRYAERQKAIISEEVEEFKSQKIEQATEAGLKDAYELIQSEVVRRKSALVSEYSVKKAQIRANLFHERSRITDEVFRKAEEKLTDYTLTEDYRRAILDSAKEIASRVGNGDCLIHIREADMIMKDDLLGIIPQAQTMIDPAIRIGGLKVYCVSDGILLDDTLDSRLAAQRKTFFERSGLKVVE